MASNSKSHRRRQRRDKQHKKPKSKSASKSEQPSTGPTSVHDVPDHLLELILLRLRSSACLLRAAAACKRWRRAITAAGFLSRCLHARSYVAGHYHAFDPDWVDHGTPPITGNPAFIPSPSSLGAAVDARRFSLDDGGVLPDSDSGWALADSRGSLLLLFKRANSHTSPDPDLLVCEPLTGRRQGILTEDTTCLGVFLLDGDRHQAGRTGIFDDFRVLTVLRECHVLEEEGRVMPVACVFSPGSDAGGWRDLPSESTNSAAVSLPSATERVTFVGRANGSLYWAIKEDDGGVAMLVLDEAAMAFSRVAFPADAADDGPNPSYDRWSFRVIGGKGGAPHVVRMVRNELMVLARRRGSGEGDEWVWEVERRVRLREATLGLPGREDTFFQRNAMIMAAHEEYVLVTPQEKTWLFSVELDTMQVELQHERNRYAGQAYPSQLPWPPSLTACATDERGRRRRRSSCR
ncbi:unnamed protein product [Urochloa decumbens]|uniref:F-box domain-containing protein n=1 Tax=Urochloa decumbens TaxID=240449 RepID=A0ABC9EY68_9POAL